MLTVDGPSAKNLGGWSEAAVIIGISGTGLSSTSDARKSAIAPAMYFIAAGLRPP